MIPSTHSSSSAGQSLFQTEICSSSVSFLITPWISSNPRRNHRTLLLPAVQLILAPQAPIVLQTTKGPPFFPCSRTQELAPFRYKWFTHMWSLVQLLLGLLQTQDRVRSPDGESFLRMHSRTRSGRSKNEKVGLAVSRCESLLAMSFSSKVVIVIGKEFLTKAEDYLRSERSRVWPGQC
ncbi:hypothetical protein MLD38_017188 [Melastoma candidum]|uniref:Uncharacterized protein n=1 Tax=Melastoma candidum TaxID=119954 RepID=A0ACB9QPR0_9MYRT|nr:hypothetical protein MLD38_017188 [Melastoma candidum]